MAPPAAWPGTIPKSFWKVFFLVLGIIIIVMIVLLSKAADTEFGGGRFPPAAEHEEYGDVHEDRRCRLPVKR